MVSGRLKLSYTGHSPKRKVSVRSIQETAGRPWPRRVRLSQGERLLRTLNFKMRDEFLDGEIVYPLRSFAAWPNAGESTTTPSDRTPQ